MNAKFYHSVTKKSIILPPTTRNVECSLAHGTHGTENTHYFLHTNTRSHTHSILLSQAPEIDLKFNQWWDEQHDQNKFSDGKMTFDTLDKYSVISYGTDLGVKFEKFSEFIKEYCWSRKRVGFWRTDEYGNHTFHFDVKNQEELDERNKEFRIKKAKELLETEGIIEPIESDYSKGI